MPGMDGLRRTEIATLAVGRLPGNGKARAVSESSRPIGAGLRRTTILRAQLARLKMLRERTLTIGLFTPRLLSCAFLKTEKLSVR